jgi:aminoglycoside phosphotransferase (APT) family kinase protein
VSDSAHGAQLGRLLRLLVDERAIDAHAVLDGRVSVTDLSRSNAVGLVHVDGRPAIVVKAGTVAVDGVDPIAAEAAAYRWLGGSPATARCAPSPVPEAARAQAIVTRPLLGAVSLHEALAARSGEEEALIAELGRVLARVHGARAGTSGLVARRPWILGVPEGRAPAMYAGNEAASAMLGEIARRPGVTAAVARLGATWTARTAIHGDLKFDNVLVVPDGAGHRLVLVDWELAGLGEPSWDLAGVVDGLVIPLRIAADAGPPVDLALVARLAEPALAAHRAVAGPALSPAPDELATAAVVRLAQSAAQLAAMGHQHPDAAAGAPRILAAATELADELAGVVAPCTP